MKRTLASPERPVTLTLPHDDETCRERGLIGSYNRAVSRSVADPLLRRAAFASGASALDAWRRWLEIRDLRDLSLVELRLLAPVYRNLREAGVPDDEIPSIVKQMTRSLWIRSRLLLRHAAMTVQCLEDNGIETILLKGAALVATGCVDAKARPMADFDLLVKREDAERAASLLAAEGWNATPAVHKETIRYRYASTLQKGDANCDLHWWALGDSRDESGDARFWSEATFGTLDGVRVRVLRPEHQLLHLIVHGTRAHETAAIRWIGDALAVTRSVSLDWSVLVGEATSRGLTHPAAEGLAYLVAHFDAAVPGGVIPALRAVPVARIHRRLYLADPDTPRADVAFLYFRALHFTRPKNAPPLWVLRNAQSMYGVRSIWLVPFVLAYRSVRRLIRRSQRA